MTETRIRVKTTLGVTDHNLLDNRFIDNQHTMNAISGLEEALESKQDVLTAGENVEISEEGVISATDTTYTAGENVEISEEGVISATDTTYTAGENVSIENGVISAVDTIYTAGENVEISEEGVISANVPEYSAGTNVSIDNGVISAVDTTYTAGTGIDITNGVISNTQTSAEWGNIEGNINSQTDLKNALDAKANSADLATVATSGLYSDLSGTPTLATVATSGDYDDLSNKPTIPTITDTYSRISHDGMSGIAVASAISSGIASVYKPAGSSTFAELPPLAAGIEGYVFNMTDDFTTTSDFVDGAGKDYPAGTNIVCILTRDGYKWDVLAGIVDLSGYQTLIDSSNKLNSDLVDDTNATNKFVTTSDKTTWNAKQDALTAGSGIDITNGVISATISGLTNTATGSGSLTILGTATGAANATNIGATSSVTGNYSTALGYGAGVVSNATRAIQIGEGTNNTSNTFSVGFGTNNYRLLDGTTGKIPNDRIGAFTGATSQASGTVGGVPAPTTSDVDKYLKGDGTWATVSSGGLQNTATGTDSLTILGTPTTQMLSINIGVNSKATDGNAIAIGTGSQASGSSSTALGSGAKATEFGATAVGEASKADNNGTIAIGAIAVADGSQSYQIGWGTNSTDKTLCVGWGATNYMLLDGTTGKIPNDRLSAFTGATSQASGTVGGVPAPTTSDVGKFLSADGTWAAAGGSVSFDGSTINENSSNELQAIGVKEARTDTAIRFWHGTQAQYNDGGSQIFYNWEGTESPYAVYNVPAIYTSGSTNDYPNRIRYLNGIYFGFAQESGSGINEKIVYSSDLNSWNDWNAGQPDGIAYGNGVYVQAGYGGVKYSTDLTNWTTAISGGWQGTQFEDVVFGNGKFVVWDRTNANVRYSTDGQNWTLNTNSMPGNITKGIGLFLNGNYIFRNYSSGTYGSVYVYSSDAENWSNITAPNSEGIVGMAYNNNTYVMLTSANKVYTASALDGTWTLATTLTGGNAVGIAYGNNKFVAALSDRAYQSDDLTTWTDFIDTAYPSSLTGATDIMFGNGKFVLAFGENALKATGASSATTVHVYTDTDTPTTASTVYSEPDVSSALTITAVGTGTIDVSDGNTYTYNSSGNQTVTYTVGDVHPNYVCNIDGVGLKIGNDDIANLASYSTFTGATGSVAGSAGLVPAPAATDNDKYLKGDGTWAAVSSGGLQNTATGYSSLTILGEPVTADYAITIGALATVTDDYGIAIGSGEGGDGGPMTEAGKSSVAIGYNAYSGTDSVAIGYGVQTKEEDVAIGGDQYGTNGTASKYSSVAIGIRASSSLYSVAVGIDSSAGVYEYDGSSGNKSRSVAVGAGAAAMYNYSIALGYAATASQDYEFVVGGYDTQNNEPQTFTLMDLSTGKIPNDRIDGATGTFTSQDGKTVTVTNGVITSIV